LKNILFIDLDDTLFHSREKCAPDVALEPAAYLRDGSPISFTSPRQRAFLSYVQAGMLLVPTTARNQDAFRRVAIDWNSYAILNYGGVVLTPDGQADRAWLEQTSAAAQHALPGLQQVAALLDDYAARHAGGKARIIEDFGVPFYVVIKDPQKDGARLAQMEQDVLQPWIAAAGRDFYIHRNGNNLAVLPHALNKANAVQYVRERLQQELGPVISFGMGDSKSDARFMAACDYAIVPRGTQLSAMTLEAL
jgi:hydroxymethylpyrimidine pyrophosphatase-like HAD family hydrolase